MAMETNYKQIGERIRKIRLKQKMTQEVLAAATDLSITHISHIETGATKASLNTILNIAYVLKCTPNDILCDHMAGAELFFSGEVAEAMVDCNEYEVRVIADIVKATKTSLRERSSFMPSSEPFKW